MPFAPRRNPIPLMAATAGALLALCIGMAAGTEEVLAALPLILLVVALVFKRYPGERLIERLSGRLHRRRRRPSSSPAPGFDEAACLSPRLLRLAPVRQLRGPPLPA